MNTYIHILKLTILVGWQELVACGRTKCGNSWPAAERAQLSPGSPAGRWQVQDGAGWEWMEAARGSSASGLWPNESGAGWGRLGVEAALVACGRKSATFPRIARRQLASAQPQLEHKWPQVFRHVHQDIHQDPHG